MQHNSGNTDGLSSDSMMALTTLSAHRSFECFPNLPIEIRCQIWSFAAPRRPRVIQVCYNPDKSLWQACKDGCGGLPSIVHVSREARAEALKSYTKAFDVFINLEEDTVFVSDPVLSIRQPQKVFLDSEYAKRLRKIAFTSDIYRGLEDTWQAFPESTHSPGKLLRMFDGLTHFTLALSEDGAGFDDDNSDVSDDHGSDDAEGEEEDEHILDESDHVQNENGDQMQSGHCDVGGDDVRTSAFTCRVLDRLDREAMATMREGYFRHVGNIHFASAMAHPDHWESWSWFADEVVNACESEKLDHQDWIRPKISIMAVKYGLKRIGDYTAELHSLGDYQDGVVETGGFKFDESETDDQDHEGDESDSDPGSP